MVNKVILVGNVGKDPEVKKLDGGMTVAKFSLATSEKYTNRQGDKVESTEWHNIVVWNRLAEIVEQYVSKGSRLYLEGKLKTRSWDGQDGTKRYTTEVFVNNMQMLSTRQESGQSQRSTQQQTRYQSQSEYQPQPSYEPEFDAPEEDLPF